MTMRTSPPLLDQADAASSRRRVSTLVLSLAALALLAVLVAPLADVLASEPAYGEKTADADVVDIVIPEDAVDAWSHVPVQEGGRVKPLFTWASYALLRMNHRRSCKTADGRKLGPTEWMLTVLFRPDAGRHLPCFVVESWEIADALGIGVEGKKKRDRYSYAELEPGKAKLFDLAGKYGRVAEKDRSPVEGGIVALAHNLRDFEGLLAFLDFTRAELPVGETLRSEFDGAETVTFSKVMAKANALVRADYARGGPGPGYQLVQRAAMAAANSGILALFPPSMHQVEQIQAAQEKDLYPALHAEEWLAPWQIPAQAMRAPSIDVAMGHVEMLAELEAMRLESPEDTKAFTEHTERFHTLGRELATGLGQYEKIDLEVTLLRTDPFGLAMWLFVIAFVLIALSWAFPNRYFVWAIWGFLALISVWLMWWIGVRCVLRERPPVSTLYETVIFITTFAVVAGLILELINRQRIALAVTAVFGVVGLFLAGRYEMLTKRDTMPQLVAVLDTNFWLTTHVTAISIGYASSLVTALVAHVYVLAKVFGVKNTGFFQRLGGMIYGMLAFSMIFSVVGTILGGVWAAESWGRFWGWDPKENGALLIVLWQLAMLHARLGGYIKSFGFAMASIALGPIVAFSWWGVNLLGIGLHSYGFTAGVWNGLLLYFAIEAFFLTVGGLWWIINRMASRPAAPGTA